MGLAVEDDERERDHRQAERDHLEPGESEVHRRAEQDADEHQHRRDQERDLLGRFPGDAERNVHVPAAAEDQRSRVLRRIPDDGDDHHADERLGQLHHLERPFQGADEQLAGGSGGCGREQQLAQRQADAFVAPFRAGARSRGRLGRRRMQRLPGRRFQ